MEEANRLLTNDLIEKKWNLEDWNDKNQTWKTEMKSCET